MLSTRAQKVTFLRGLGFKGSFAGMTRRFQRAYNLGKWLTIDGDFGPKTTEAALRVMKNGGRISRNFKPEEFACPCGGKFRKCLGVKIDRKILKGLEAVRREYYPEGLAIVSGYRCPEFNAQVGGIAGSQHTKGLAADIPRKIHYRDFNQPSKYIRQVGFSRWDGKVIHVDFKRGVSYHEFLDTAGSNP